MMPLGTSSCSCSASATAWFGLLVSAYTLAAGVPRVWPPLPCVDRFDRKHLLLTLARAVRPGHAGVRAGAGLRFLVMVARVAAGLFRWRAVRAGANHRGRCRCPSNAVAVPWASSCRPSPSPPWRGARGPVHDPPPGLAGALHQYRTALAVCWPWRHAFTLPPLAHHLQVTNRPSVWRGIAQVLADATSAAFAFSALLIFHRLHHAHITIYMQANVGLRRSDLPRGRHYRCSPRA